MKLLIATSVFFLCSVCWAAPNASDYKLTVHVSESRIAYICDAYFKIPCLGPEQLTATIDGKKYELAEGDYFKRASSRRGLLATGDYKARIVRDEHVKSYETIRVYELLFPDNTTQRYSVVGVSE